MSMDEFRQLAAKMDLHMQQLDAQGVHEAGAIVDRMMGYMPDLQKIWVAASDAQLMQLSREFPRFHHCALIIEDAFEAERNRTSRPYDAMAEFSEQHRLQAAQLLTTAATLERGYGAFGDSRKPRVFQSEIEELARLHRQWLSEVESFKNSLRAQGVAPLAMEYLNEAFARLSTRIKPLAG